LLVGPGLVLPCVTLGRVVLLLALLVTVLLLLWALLLLQLLWGLQGAALLGCGPGSAALPRRRHIQDRQVDLSRPFRRCRCRCCFHCCYPEARLTPAPAEGCRGLPQGRLAGCRVLI
jgi:hypothetical protein